MKLLIIAIALLFYVAKSVEDNCNNNKGNNKWLTSVRNLKKDSVKNITLAYFQYHGVRSLNLIVCPAENTAPKISSIVLFYMEHNLPVRVWSGEDYLSEMPKREVFGPPITFREIKNDTHRRPLKLKLEPLAHKTGVILMDFNTPCALNVLRWSAASENNYFKTNSFWLLITKDIADLKALEDEDIFLPPDSEVKVLVEEVNKRFSLVDVYKVAAFKPLKHNIVVGNFSDVQEMSKALSSYGSVISLREDLEGIVFNTGLVINFPDMFTDIEDLSLRHIDTMAKVTNRLVVDMARKLNLRFNTYQTDNYGWHKPNGSFSGLMGRFQRYELDFGQMAFFMRLDRTKVCNFLVETFRIRAGIMFRQPPLSSVANIFTMPFDIKVWICLIILVVVTICVFALELALSPHTHEMHYWDCAIFVWGAMCQQGFYGSVSNLSARIIIFTTFVATLFLFISFSANIVALLQSPSEAIRTLSDLSHSSLELGVMDTVYNRVFLNESTDPVTRYLYRKKILPKGESIYMSPAAGINKMRYETFAFQVELQTGYQIISDTFSEPEKCGLKEMEPYKLPMIAVPTRKNFPYKELFRRQLRWQREVGLMNREEMKWFTQRPKCEGLGRFVSIGLKECRYAWAVLGWGCLFALIALGCELLVKNNQELQGVGKSVLMQDIMLAYFRYHGVHSLNIIRCPSNETSTLKLSSLAWFFLKHNMLLHVWWGRDYLQEMPEPPLYGPANTFKVFSNDTYRRPLKFKLEPLAHKTGVLLMDFNTPCGLNVLRWSAASENNYFTTNKFWLLTTKHFSDLTALNDEDIFLPPDGEVKVLVKDPEKGRYSLLDVYKVAAFKPLKLNFVLQNFNEVKNMLKALKNYGSVISLRENLENITFNTAMVIAFPDMFTNIEDLSMRHIDTISKVNNRLTIELANQLNMHFNTHQTDNYGWHQPNGSFDGLMGQFQRYEMDFAQLAIFMRLDRMALCDFVAETFRVRAGVMFRQPPLSAVANIFAMPFENDVWISLVVLVIVTICLFALELLFSPYNHQMDYLDCAVFVWGAMCQQGFYVAVGNCSARIIIFTTFVATLFLFTSFSANIVALLQSPSEAIHTLKDLSQSPLEIGVQDTVYNKIYFTVS
ncbi:uncharacterized protein LOC119607912 [Lucilia sericata]|uniref:uncharacterized protein LOC119607912 n=1 Tax=Lucilia sericata TaxID=13632 RepID=UPI0018A7F436|nr:uncharacterized protein LOC119607912 [Lucilia sericata]